MKHLTAPSVAALALAGFACGQASPTPGAKVADYLLVLDGTGEPAGLQVQRRYRHLPMLHVQASESGVQALLRTPGVLRAEPQVEYFPALAQSLPLIGQPAVAAAGYRGAGATVVVADGPVDISNAAFGKCSKGELGAPGCKLVAAERIADPAAGSLSNGHGNNVAAIVLGVAPDARVAALDVFRGGTAFTPDLLAAIDWAIEHKDRLNIAALNLSLGAGAHDKPCGDDTLALAIAWARAAGIVTTVAAGNEGHSAALAAPACAPAAVSVGAVYKSALGGFDFAGCLDQVTAADQVACFSNTAPFLTLLAPGAVISAAGLNMAGTSQAAPHVAGAAAVLRAAFPAETVDQLVTRLKTSSAVITDHRNGLSVPRLDLPSAISAPAARQQMGSLSINAGAAVTNSPRVTISLTPLNASHLSEMCITNGVSCFEWLPYRESIDWTLDGGTGPRTVRAWLRDVDGNQSAREVTASVLLEKT